MNKTFTYLSLGAGVQSSALLVMANLRLYSVPRPDVAIFADTHCEPEWVYRQLWTLAAWSEIPVHVCSTGDMMRRNGKSLGVMHIPAFTENGMLKRQCTANYKINPIRKHVRAMLGYRPRQRVRHSVTALMGISQNECHRMKPSRDRWIENRWPLVDAGLNRQDCLNVLRQYLPELEHSRRSSCYFCPFKSDREWRELRQIEPHTFEKACAADEMLRVSETYSGRKDKGLFVHRSKVPLRNVEFWDNQMDMFGAECEGICGV